MTKISNKRRQIIISVTRTPRIEQWNQVADESGPSFAWHTYQKPAPEKNEVDL